MGNSVIHFFRAPSEQKFNTQSLGRDQCEQIEFISIAQSRPRETFILKQKLVINSFDKKSIVMFWFLLQN